MSDNVEEASCKGMKIRSQDVRSVSASRPQNGGKKLRRHLGERFHADAYGRWAAGETFVEAGRELGVSERQVRRWAVAERWKARLEATQRKAETLAVNKDAERLARMAIRHRRGARALQQYAEGLLSCGAVVLDPRTNRPYVVTRADGTAGGFVFRPLLPAELNQATQAFFKAAELEYGRAGGKAAPAETEHRFPDLTKLLNEVWAERQAKKVGEGSTTPPPWPKADPRLL